MAAVRATHEATVTDRGETLCPSSSARPIAGEEIAGQRFDGKTETAVFPGDLPEDASRILQAREDGSGALDPMTFVRFRPPRLERTAEGLTLSLPQIRLDRALQFLLGDRLA